MSNLSDRIKTAIEKSGMTQRAVAEKIGTTEQSVSRYVNGERTPRALTLAKLAEVLNTPVEWFLTGKEEHTKHVEMIIDYITDGSDYQYSDNHGVLTRCIECKYWDHELCTRNGEGGFEFMDAHDYCSKVVKA